MNIQLVTGDDNLQIPVVIGDIKWDLERKGSPGKLTFTVLSDDILVLNEGDPVSLIVDDKPLFYGFVFTKKRSKDKQIEVTAYDQLRYLKNSDAVNYQNKTATQVIQMLAADFDLECGEISDTGYVIPAYGESNVTLFDAILDALDETLQATGELYVLYDDYGAITLKKIGELQSDLLLDSQTAEDYDYESSIDTDTYSKVKLVYEDKESGMRQVFTAEDQSAMNDWGVLQYFDTVTSIEGASEKAATLLNFYKRVTRKLSFSKVFGDTSIRAGSTIGVYLELDDMTISNYMMVEKVTHTFSNGNHFMDLTLIGGDFVA